MLPESLSSLKSLARQALGQGSPMETGQSEDMDRGHLAMGGGGHKNDAHIPPLLGVAPLGIVPLGKDHQFQFR